MFYMNAKNLGRPRNFNEDEALEKALHVFWTKGYEGTSLTDLITEMGINKPSLYAAFGDKEQLFQKATDYYARTYTEAVSEALSRPDFKDSISAFFNCGIEFMTGSNGKHPLGCMAVHGTNTYNEDPTLPEMAILKLREGFEKMIYDRIQKAVKENDFSKDLNPKDYAKFLTSVYQGMAIQAVTSAKKSELKKIASIALSTLS